MKKILKKIDQVMQCEFQGKRIKNYYVMWHKKVQMIKLIKQFMTSFYCFHKILERATTSKSEAMFSSSCAIVSGSRPNNFLETDNHCQNKPRKDSKISLTNTRSGRPFLVPFLQVRSENESSRDEKSSRLWYPWNIPPGASYLSVRSTLHRSEYPLHPQLHMVFRRDWHSRP